MGRRRWAVLGFALGALVLGSGGPAAAQGGDTSPPTVTAPASFIRTLPPGASSMVVSWSVDATDNIGVTSISCTRTSGATYGPGVYPTTCAALDAAGNAGSASFTFTVVDAEPPRITAPANRNVGTGNASTATVTWPDPVATDNVGVTSVTCTYPSGSTLAVGVYSNTCTARDAAGNSAAASFTISVIDNWAPTVSVPASFNRTLPPGASSMVVTWPDPVATDNIGVTSISCTRTSGATYGPGAYPTTCAALDAAGNAGSASFTFTVVDAEPPVLTVPANRNVGTGDAATATVTWPDPTATDNVGVTSLTCTRSSGTSLAPGVYPVTCTARDAAGNVDLDSFTISVIDNWAPTVSAPASFSRTLPPGASSMVITWPDPVATDNIGVASVTCTRTSGATYGPGAYPTTCAALDAAGNAGSASFTFTVVDAEAPILTVPTNRIVRTGNAATATVTWPDPTATDNVGVTSISCTRTSGAAYAPGVYPVTCTARDAAGNIDSDSFVVTVIDDWAPAVTAPASFIRTLPPGASSMVVTWSVDATDNIGVTSISCTRTSGATYGPGVYPTTCAALDAAGNAGSASFVFTVVDAEAPVLTVPESITTPTDPGSSTATVTWPDPTATDNIGVTRISCTRASGAVLAVGTYPVTCTARDAAGNQDEESFTVRVIDQEDPLLTVPDDIRVPTDPGKATAEVTWPAPTATDNVGVTSLTCTRDSGDRFPVGEATVTCTARDGDGNEVRKDFTVTVTDPEPPAIEVPTDPMVTLAPGAATAEVTWPAPTATDNDEIRSVACAPASGSRFDAGTTRVVCTATDRSGNEATGRFTVTVTDAEAPVLVLPGDVSVPASSPDGAVVRYDVSATDNVRATDVTCRPASGRTFPVGATPVTCTATDAAGNSTDGSFTVTVTVDAGSIAALSDTIAASGIKRSLAANLTSRLDDAARLLTDGRTRNDPRGCQRLAGFQDALARAIERERVDPVVADTWSRFALEIATAAGC